MPRLSSHHIPFIFFCAALGAVLVFGVSFVRPLEYSSTVKLLILQKGPGSTDAYTAIKAIETIGDNMAQVVHTTSFFQLVMQQDSSIRTTYFSGNEEKRRKTWDRMVDAHIGRGTGFLRLTVYHPDKREARKIVEAISQVFVLHGWEYANANIEVKVVDAPLESLFPVRPNLAANALTGFFFGGIIGALYLVMRQKKIS